MPGLKDELWRFAVIEILRARRWKFCVEIIFLFGSLSGSGVSVRGGELRFESNVTPGGGDDDADKLARWSGASSDAGKWTGEARTGSVGKTELEGN